MENAKYVRDRICTAIDSNVIYEINLEEAKNQNKEKIKKYIWSSRIALIIKLPFLYYHMFYVFQKYFN